MLGRVLRANGANIIGSICFVLLNVAAVAQQPPPAPKPEPGKTPAAQPEAPAPETAAPVDPKTYKIGAEDVLLIRVWKEPELSGSVSVRPDGRITVPLVGEVEAWNLTPEQLQTRLTKEFSNFVNSPVVMVYVMAVRSKKYFLSGKLNRSGEVSLVVPTTIMEAISKAGGFQDFANQKKVLILRGNQRLIFNYKDYIKGKNPQQNILLEAGDHIIVE